MLLFTEAEAHSVAYHTFPKLGQTHLQHSAATFSYSHNEVADRQQMRRDDIRRQVVSTWPDTRRNEKLNPRKHRKQRARRDKITRNSWVLSFQSASTPSCNPLTYSVDEDAMVCTAPVTRTSNQLSKAESSLPANATDPGTTDLWTAASRNGVMHAARKISAQGPWGQVIFAGT